MKNPVAIALLAAALLAGCGTTTDLFEGKKIDYKSAGKLPPLEIPPDLTAPSGDDRYAVPDTAATGSATYSGYNRDRAAAPKASSNVVLPAAPKVRIERSGNQRWLVVQAEPDQVWPAVREFWQENGFILKLETPEAGVMETDWAENRAIIPQDFIRSTLGKVLDSVYSTSLRDKFRTRLERNVEPGYTEIYISHRGMEEVVEGGVVSSRFVWQPREPDPELEAEFLRRLMAKLGVEEKRAQAALNAPERPQVRATLSKGRDGNSNLALNDAFDRAWRRVGLALDRIGFTVEDRDRSKGLYFVRYVDPEADDPQKKDGWLSKLNPFSGSGKKDKNPIQYRIAVQGQTQGTDVSVLTKDGAPEKSDTAGRILTMLYEQLK